MKLILLPGLDGSGILFNDLIKFFPSDISFQTVNLNKIDGLSYGDQATEIATLIGNEEVVLVGESYSGPIVYELCKLLGTKVREVIFLASFISSPSYLSRLAPYLPKMLLKSNFLSKKIINLMGFNGNASNSNIKAVFESLDSADLTKLYSRLRNIADIAQPRDRVAVRAKYIKPSRDLLVSSNCVTTIEAMFDTCVVIEIQGGHFIAQCSPAECAKAIFDTIYFDKV